MSVVTRAAAATSIAFQGEMVYVRLYRHSGERSQVLRRWRQQYDWHQPHIEVGASPRKPA